MDFKSANDKVLIRNCALVQIQRLEKSQDINSDSLREFQEFINALNTSSYAKAHFILSNASTRELQDFSKEMQKSSAKAFAQHHINIIERNFKKTK